MPKKLNKPRVLGVLAGQDFPLSRLAAWAKSADTLLAADSGADTLQKVNILPAATVGDLDSISIESKALQRELVQIDDQNFTDCDKLLRLAADRGYTEISLICVEGDLLDHMLGVLLSAAKSNLNVRLILRRGVAFLLKGPTESHFKLPPNARLSLMPIVPCNGVTLTGTQWPLQNAALSPLGLTSLSNRAIGNVSVTIEEGTAVLFQAHPTLEEVHW